MFARVQSVDRRMLLRRHVRIEVPRRNSDLLGDVVDAIDGTSFVHACNDECLVDSGKRAGDKLRLESLPLTFSLADRDLAGLHQAVD